jgi:DNA-binding response OmpR family regulator
MATVLIVDDEIAITEFLSETLQDEGHSVFVCYNGAQALQRIHNQLPDLVLLDINMPVMDGAQVLQELRANAQSTLPIIVLSAQHHIEQYLDMGATAVIAKPFAISALLETVDQVIA